MPGFTTHYLFGVKAYNNLPNAYLKHVISKYRWLYQLGLQEPVEQGRCSIQLMFDYYMSGKRVVPQDHITDTVIKIKENID